MTTESFIDYCAAPDILSATARVNELVKINEDAGWMMIQCQLLQHESMFIYSTVYQRVKEQIVKKSCEQLIGEYAAQKQSSGEIPVGDEPQACEEV
jgi:hypothetical protein